MDQGRTVWWAVVSAPSAEQASKVVLDALSAKAGRQISSDNIFWLQDMGTKKVLKTGGGMETWSDLREYSALKKLNVDRAANLKNMPKPTGDAALIYKALTGAMPGEQPLFLEEVGVLPLKEGGFVAAVENTSPYDDVSWYDYCDNYGTDDKGREIELDPEDSSEAVRLARASDPRFVQLYPPRQFTYGVFRYE